MNLLKLVPLVIVLICIPLVLVTADTTFDSIDYGVSVDICTTPGHCPHAMLIYPVNNSIINEVNVPLTVYIYDDDETVWELNITWYTNDSTIIDKQTVATDREVTTTWTNREPGTEYSWYVFVENSTGNITTGTFNFTINNDPLFGSIYSIILFMVLTGLFIIMAEWKQTFPWYMALILTMLMSITILSKNGIGIDSAGLYLLTLYIILIIYYVLRFMFLIFEGGKHG